MPLLQEVSEKYHGGMTKKQKRGVAMGMLWLTWVIVGTLWYAFAPHYTLGFGRGYWMAINIGYSIGTGYPMDPDFPELFFFSAVYVLVGAAFISLAFSFFIDKIGEDCDNWFTNLTQEQAYNDAFETGTFCERIDQFRIYHSAALRAVGVWFGWVTVMAIFGIAVVDGWDGKQGYYYAISTCSTGGLYGLPQGSPDWAFGITAFLAMLGVPIMGIAMASLSTFFIDTGDLEASKEDIAEQIKLEELEMLASCGFEDNDGSIDRAEFIILCMVRMGSDPELIKFIIEQFEELDADGGGTLSIREITHGKYRFVDGNIVKCTKEERNKILENQRKQRAEAAGVALKVTPKGKTKSLDDDDSTPLPFLNGTPLDMEQTMYEAATAGDFILAGQLQTQLKGFKMSEVPEDLSPDTPTSEESDVVVEAIMPELASGNDNKDDDQGGVIA